MNENGPFEAFNNSIPKITFSEGLTEELMNLEITTIPPESITKIVFPKMTPLESIEIGNGFLPEEEPEDIMNMKMVDFVEMTNYIVAIATGEPHYVEARIAEMAKKISVKELVEIGDKFRVLGTEEPDADCEDAPEEEPEEEPAKLKGKVLRKNIKKAEKIADRIGETPTSPENEYAFGFLHGFRKAIEFIKEEGVTEKEILDKSDGFGKAEF